MTTEISPAPMTPTEERVAEIFAQFLDLEFVEPDDNVFSLGGDSMEAVRIALEIERQFEIKLPMEEFGESESVRELAAWIDKLKDADPG